MATSNSGPAPVCARPNDMPAYRPGKTKRKRSGKVKAFDHHHTYLRMLPDYRAMVTA